MCRPCRWSRLSTCCAAVLKLTCCKTAHIDVVHIALRLHTTRGRRASHSDETTEARMRERSDRGGSVRRVRHRCCAPLRGVTVRRCHSSACSSALVGALVCVVESDPHSSVDIASRVTAASSAAAAAAV